MSEGVKVVARGSFPSSKETLKRETINFNSAKRFIRRIRKMLKRGK